MAFRHLAAMRRADEARFRRTGRWPQPAPLTWSEWSVLVAVFAVPLGAAAIAMAAR